MHPSGDTWRTMWRLTLPVLAEESLTLLIGYTDWWLTGRFLQQAEYLAAMALMAYVMWLLHSLFATVSIGATAIVARYVGARDLAMATRVAQQALVAGGLMALGLTGLVWLAGPSFIALLQLRGEAADLVWQYLRIVIPVLPFIMLEQVAAACLRGAGDTVAGFAAKTVVNVVNMTISPLCLLGIGFMPELGWKGLAIGTAAGHAVGGALLLAMLLRGRAGLQIRITGGWWDPELLRRILRIGIPAGIDMGAVVTCHLIYVGIINALGTTAAAVHGLGVQIEALSYLPGTAFQVAASTLAGQYLGAGQGGRASQAVTLTCLCGCCVLTMAAAAFLFAGEWLAAFFTGDRTAPITQQTGQLLKIVAISTPSLGVLSILTGGLRGAGDTRWPLLVTLVGLVGIRIPVSCVLAWDTFTIPVVGTAIQGLGWGVEGAWWAMTLDVVLRSWMVTARFLHGGWGRIHV